MKQVNRSRGGRVVELLLHWPSYGRFGGWDITYEARDIKTLVACIVEEGESSSSSSRILSKKL
jgi:hypothetical protein